MISSVGRDNLSADSQTLNRSEWVKCFNLTLDPLTNPFLFCGPLLVSRTGDAGWTEYQVKEPDSRDIRPHKGCGFITTAGRWPWRLEPAQECVTTHLPNESAPKMDGAKPWILYLMGVGKKNHLPPVGGREDKIWRSKRELNWIYL